MALDWEFDEEHCRWRAESKHIGEKGLLYWQINVREEGTFDCDEMPEELQVVGTKRHFWLEELGDFATLREAKMWCQAGEDLEPVALGISRVRR